MVRATVDAPAIFGGANDVGTLALHIQHGQGMVTHIGLEHVAPQRADASVRSLRQGNAAAFATVVGHLDVGAERDAAVERHVAVDGRTPVGRFAAHARRRLQVALVDPHGV